MAQAQQPPASAASTLDALRKEVAKLNAMLRETDEALDEWVAECDRLQRELAAKDADVKRMSAALSEAQRKLNVDGKDKDAQLKARQAEAVQARQQLDEERMRAANRIQELGAALAQARADADVERTELEKSRKALAEAAAGKAELERAAADSSRLEAVRHAQELELKELRAKLADANTRAETSANCIPELEVKSAVQGFQLSVVQDEDATVTNWLKALMRMGARL